MKRKIKSTAVSALLAAAFVSSPIHAASTSDDSPRGVVDKLFDAMRQGDGDLLRTYFLPGAKLDRRRADGSHVQSSFDNWAKGVARAGAGDLDEQIFDVTVQQFGGIAQVHAPFQIWVKGELRGCGVNQFALAKVEGGWKLTYGMDTQDSGDCATFKERYKAR